MRSDDLRSASNVFRSAISDFAIPDRLLPAQSRIPGMQTVVGPAPSAAASSAVARDRIVTAAPSPGT